MALNTFNLASPDYGLGKSSSPRFKKVNFGDGYEQRSSDGLNTDLKTFNLTFKGLPALMKSIEEFFEGQAANGLTPFLWVDPDGVTRTVVAEKWDRRFDSPNWHSVVTTFREVPEK